MVVHFDAEIVSDLASGITFTQCPFDVSDSLSTSLFLAQDDRSMHISSHGNSWVAIFRNLESEYDVNVN